MMIVTEVEKETFEEDDKLGYTVGLRHAHERALPRVLSSYFGFILSFKTECCSSCTSTCNYPFQFLTDQHEICQKGLSREL